MKKCIRCNVLKDISKFGKNKLSKDGLKGSCNRCLADETFNRNRTKMGLPCRIIGNQRLNSKSRNHVAPEYSIAELRDWLYEQHKYHELFKEWVNSEYNTDKVPSVDRVNDSLPYTISNIQLMTWKENREKWYKIIRLDKSLNSQLLNGGHSEVYKYTLDDIFICKYISQSEAARKNNCHQANINKVLDGKLNKTGGFKWKRQ